MGLLDFLKGPDIDEGVRQFHNTPNSVLLDVRTPEEYRAGRIPGSRNIPVDALNEVAAVVRDMHAPLFVYCHSGARSRWAVGMLRKMGYEHVTNIGGIYKYHGKVEL